MKKTVLALLFSAMLAVAMPAVYSNAEELTLGDIVLEVSEDDVLVQADVNTKPSGNLNEANIKVVPTAYTIGENTYVFAEYKNPDDSWVNGKLFEGETSYYNRGSREFAEYIVSYYVLPAFTGSKEITIGYYNDSSEWVAYTAATVTAAPYTAGSTLHLVPVESKSEYLNIVLPEEFPAEAVEIFLYDGTEKVGSALMSTYSYTSSTAYMGSLLSGLHIESLSLGTSNTYYRYSGTLYFAKPLTGGKSYQLKAVAGSKVYELGEVMMFGEKIVSNVYSTSNYASDLPVVQVTFMNAEAKDFYVEMLDDTSAVVASSKDGGQVIPIYEGTGYYELNTTKTLDELEGNEIVVKDVVTGMKIASSNFWQYPNVAGSYYDYTDKVVVLMTYSIPDNTIINASVEYAGVTYTAVGTVLDNKTKLAFGNEGQAFEFPAGNFRIEMTYTLPNYTNDRNTSQYIYIDGERTNNSYSGINKSYFMEGFESQEFTFTVSNDILEGTSGTYTAALLDYNSGDVVGNKFALTKTAIDLNGTVGVKLTGIWTTATAGVGLPYGRYRLSLMDGDTTILNYSVRVLSYNRFYASIYGFYNNDGTGYVNIQAPYVEEQVYDMTTYQVQVSDFAGNPLDVTLTQTNIRDRSIGYSIAGIPSDLNGFILTATYDGKEVYEYTNPAGAREKAYVMKENDSIGMYQDSPYGITSIYAEIPAIIEIRELASTKLLKRFTVEVGQTYFTEELLAGLNYNKKQVQYSILALKTDGSFGAYTESYLALSDYVPEPDPTPSVDVEKIEAFVTRMYETTLGRTPDASGLETWTTGLIDQTFTGVDVAYGFIMSAEMENKGLSNSEYVDILYQAFFGREADQAGKDFWVGYLDAGTSKKFVLAGFVNSNEFDALCTEYGIVRGTMDVTGEVVVAPGLKSFVERLYDKVLGRTADADGLATWTNYISSGQATPEEAAKMFFASDEFVAKQLDDSAYVEVLYETFLGRTADADGKTFWLQQIAGGMTKEQVLEGFSRSTEFAAIMESFGL